jgi:ribonuclease VapC
MVIDTSAIIAILRNEPEGESMAKAILEDPVRMMSAASLLEASMVMESNRGPIAGRELDLLLHRLRIDVIPFDGEQAEIARVAWRRFGKGNHPARLNYCDCCAYALARTAGEKLLFKGDDFSQTDLGRVI